MIHVALDLLCGKEMNGIDDFMIALLCRFRYVTIT
jgi:hypothetical protein